MWAAVIAAWSFAFAWLNGCQSRGACLTSCDMSMRWMRQLPGYGSTHKNRKFSVMKRNSSQSGSAAGQALLCGSQFCQGLLLLFSAMLCLLGAPMAQAATSTWTGASGTDTNWSNGLNWDVGAPGPADDAVFSAAGVVFDTSINNYVDASTTISTLSYNQTGASTYQNTFIGDGLTLSIFNSLTTNALFVGAGLDLGSVDTLVTISGPNGVLTVTAVNGVFSVRQGGLNHFSGTA